MLEIYQLFQTLTYYYHLSLLFIFIFQYLIKYFTLYTKKVHLILDYPLIGCIMYLRVRENKPQNKEIEMAKLTAIADSRAKITNFGSSQLSATCPFETAYREFTLSNGDKYRWYADKADNLPQGNQEVCLMAWGTDEDTLRRVFVSYKDYKGMMRTEGMARADKNLVGKFFN